MNDFPSGLQLIEPTRHEDGRGWFVESYSEQGFAERGIFERFVQDNHSLSRPVFTLRGLHFQLPPYTQSKVVRCLRGRVFDVAVDLRAGSAHWGQWMAAELSAENGLQLYIPAGFAHGFLTLERDCEVAYKVSAPYVASHDRGLRWDDPVLDIDWPLPPGTAPALSPKDAALPFLGQLGQPFPCAAALA